ncbi:hypothetical protein BCR37DRAFT_392831 [Protomyces lactucae-debilis]|uniref:Uncharacterized protein n=1 Tax=Protomyces lactucae-debilis TaxID=2754530 RepID=A0A1Y2FG79_PROLT|nr:uncharacterized protein BCR37DRAFT_392831 [Protomyces lactucae-debilis]ORY82627.1 hypothetical protein BCR37DRAFT_392831 [Protomyces lactucae-debilis]
MQFIQITSLALALVAGSNALVSSNSTRLNGTNVTTPTLPPAPVSGSTMVQVTGSLFGVAAMAGLMSLL